MTFLARLKAAYRAFFQQPTEWSDLMTSIERLQAAATAVVAYADKIKTDLANADQSPAIDAVSAQLEAALPVVAPAPVPPVV
jgi:hypothetical protein